MKFGHPVTLEPEVTGERYIGLYTLIEPYRRKKSETKIFLPKIMWFQVKWPIQTVLLSLFVRI